MTFTKGRSTSTPARSPPHSDLVSVPNDPVYPVNSCFTQIFEWRTKILCLLQFFPEVAQNSLSFPCSEKSLSIPGFPGLWPLWQRLMRRAVDMWHKRVGRHTQTHIYTAWLRSAAVTVRKAVMIREWLRPAGEDDFDVVVAVWEAWAATSTEYTQLRLVSAESELLAERHTHRHTHTLKTHANSNETNLGLSSIAVRVGRFKSMENRDLNQFFVQKIKWFKSHLFSCFSLYIMLQRIIYITKVMKLWLLVAYLLFAQQEYNRK